MDEKPKSIWKKSICLPQLFLVWLGLMVTTMLIIVGIMMVIHQPVIESHGVSGVLIFGAAGATVLLAGWIFVRWLFCQRNLKRSLFGLACFVTLIALFYAEEDWRGWHAWNQFKHQWEAKGEHFDFASVIPPPVPDDQNFAMAPVVASCYERILDKNGKRVNNTNVVNRLDFSVMRDANTGDNPQFGSWQKATLTDLKGWQQYYRSPTETNSPKFNPNEFPVAPQPQSPAQDVLLALSKYDPTVEELRQAGQLPQCRFPLNYDTECPADILVPELAAMKSSIQLLHLRAIAELQNGPSNQALADVKLMLRLTEAIRTEPFLISQLVRIAMWQITLQPVYEGLAEHRWSDTQLVALAAELAKMDFLADYGFAIRGERGCNIGIIEYLRHARHKIRALTDLTGELEGHGNSGFHLQYAMLAYGPSGWFDQNELRMCRFFARWYLPVADVQARVFLPHAYDGADPAFGAEMRHKNPCNFLERLFIPALGAWARKCAWSQASLDLARTAIALERYRLARGEFPESLDALAPQFIAKVPHDVIGGGLLKYRRTDDGQFVFYSVGWNEKDDGGVVALSGPFGKSGNVDINKGDWVWRYPAK